MTPIESDPIEDVPPPAPPEPEPQVAAPPVEDVTPPALTPEEVLDAVGRVIDEIEIPNLDSEHAKKWLSDLKLPLASMTTNAIIGLVQSRVADTTDAVLEEVYAKLKPAELNQVLTGNLASLERIKNVRVREALMIRQTKDTLSAVAASIVMSALLRVLGVPTVTAAIK